MSINGLGIVLEETDLRSQNAVANPQSFSPGESDIYEANEALLPPLPDENPASLTAISAFHAKLNSPTLLQNVFTPVDAHELSVPQQSHVVLSDLFAQPLDLLLDPQALNDTPLAEPYVLASVAPIQYLPPASPTQTSPLKRLRNGIRKLSLSKSHTSPQALLVSTLSVSVSNLISAGLTLAASAQLAASTMLSPQEFPMLRPHLTPLQVDPVALDGVASSVESLNSGTMSSRTMSSSIARKNSSTNTTPQESYNSSTPTPFIPKARHSQSSYSASMSHSLPQPVITLSDNLSAASDLLAVEMSFFDGLCSNTESTLPIASISRLKSSDDLIEYLHFLNEHKQSVESAYEATKHCLATSGWCSSHDLENLSLQKDSALCQIDTKLLQIEEQLNSRFQMSIFENPVQTSHSVAGKNSRAASLSPSLKVLESRCLSFSHSQA